MGINSHERGGQIAFHILTNTLVHIEINTFGHTEMRF